MKSYRIVKKEEDPVIPLNKVDIEKGFIIALSDEEAIGIIVYDMCQEQYMLISCFFDDFTGGVESDYSAKELEDLMKAIEKDYAPPIQFNFVKV